MRQVLQNLGSGETEIADLPSPATRPGTLLIRARRSLVSPGTERMLVEFGRSGFLGKARQQPEKVLDVLDKIRTDGLLPTIEAVRSKLDQPLPLGYSSAGEVVEVGAGVSGWKVGDRVASNGPHAELAVVPTNLCAKIPADVSDDAAAFTVLASIALQGVRLLQPTLGETVVVTGLGLIGQLAVQLLRSSGCNVIGIDLDEKRLRLARSWGASTVNPASGEDPVAFAMNATQGRGVDGVLLAASTRSSEPVGQAARMSRKRGRVVLVGVTGLELSRADFYEKEITFQVSCSYGPGRYDIDYEQKGTDYPIGFVRWTEQRNFEAVLGLLSEGRLEVEPLISSRFAIAEASEAYRSLLEDRSALGILIEYPEQALAETRRSTVELRSAPPVPTSKASAGVSFIGAGNYAGRFLIPAFVKAGGDLQTVVSSGGASGDHYGRKLGFRRSSTDVSSVLEDPQTSVVVIATRHDSHARLVCDALAAGKHVFVEKPLALTSDEVDTIEQVWNVVNSGAEGTLLTVGFNRRFAPQVEKISTLLHAINEPKAFVMTVNAGAIPLNHWTQDPDVGGGRIIGEACHFVDLLRHLADSPIAGFDVAAMGGASTSEPRSDKCTFTLRFENGSIGTVHYLANGNKSFPKERLEVFCGGSVLQLDNFRRLRGFGWRGFEKLNLWRQDKGQAACARAFVDAVRQGKQAPIPFDQLIEVARVTIEIAAVAR